MAKQRKTQPVQVVVLPPVYQRQGATSSGNNRNGSQQLRLTWPDFPVRPAYTGEPTEVEKAEGEKRLKLVIEILGETDLKRLQELIDRQNGDGDKVTETETK